MLSEDTYFTQINMDYFYSPIFFFTFQSLVTVW